MANKTSGNRDEKGWFLPGHKVNSSIEKGGKHKKAIGRAPRKKEEKYLKKLSQLITMREWTVICQRALQDAKDGDPAARKWIGEYLMGKPNPVFDERFHHNLIPGAGTFDEPDFDQPVKRVFERMSNIRERLIVDGESVVIDMRDE